MNADHIILGRISGLHGVKGWVKVHSHTQSREDILAYREWYLDGAAVELTQGRIHGKGIVAKLAGIDDRDAAAGLIGREISIPRSALPEPEEGQYYWSDLQGCRVTTTQGDELGEVDYLFATGANDVMVVKGDRERLLPFIESVILEVDLTERSIRVDWDKDF